MQMGPDVQQGTDVHLLFTILKLRRDDDTKWSILNIKL